MHGGSVAILILLPVLFTAREGRSDGPDTTGVSSYRSDCRYSSETSVSRGEGAMRGVLLPAGDLFRPLIADMKQPRFYAGYRRVRFRGPGAPAEEQGNPIDAAVVAFGGNFGLWAWREVEGCDGLQVNIHAGIFSQFNLSTSSIDLINTDFIVGIPLTYRKGIFSSRLRLFHQSSHLGDEFLLHNPEVDRVDISLEAMDLILSLQDAWWRLYAGAGRLIRHGPDLEAGMAQWGFEFCGSPWRWTLLRQAQLKPVLAADLTSFEERDWALTLSMKAGAEMKSLFGPQRFRVFLVYLRGFVPFGQFFNTEKIENYGLAVQFEI